jgi:hypothetical protein
MNIGDHSKTTLLAYLPKEPKIATIKTNDAAVETVGIEIVV